jgi:hypothetical protein
MAAAATPVSRATADPEAFRARTGARDRFREQLQAVARETYWLETRARRLIDARPVVSECVRWDARLGEALNRLRPVRAVVQDLGEPNETRCARCGSTSGVELHHWAPRERFGADADGWPTARLCRDCRATWYFRTMCA